MGNALGLGGASSLLVGGILLALAVAVTFLVRRRLAGGDTGVPDLGAYPPEMVGYLTGGRTNAADAVLASLHAWGALDMTPGPGPGSVRWLEAVGPVPDRATALERAAYATAPGPLVRSSRRRVRKLSEMDDLEADLCERGLLVERATRGQARLVTAVAWLPVLLFVLAGIDANTLTSMQALVVTPLVGISAIVSVIEVPRQRTDGRDLVWALRREGREHAVTNGRARFGPGGAGMAVALYGVGAMTLVDPAFAWHFRASQPLTRSASSGGGCGSSFGTGTSCGGGGCGGGGSCGGGGCGGGGCGGGGS